MFLALDVTDETLEAALSWGADLMITHHPLIFSARKSVTDGDFIGRRLVKLLQHDISYYAMHTNFDVMGMADANIVMVAVLFNVQFAMAMALSF